jgi:3-dehydroquinate dehydratase/shikimate dehydrogenase
MTFIALSLHVDRADGISGPLDRARAAAAAGAALVEWRIDRLAAERDALGATVRLVRESPLPCVVTVRPQWEGGSYEGDETHRLSLLRQVLAAEVPPRYLDLELAAVRQGSPGAESVLAEARRRGETGIILSSHDLHDRPPDLLRRIEAMATEPSCAVIKVAWTARSLRSNLEAFDLLAARHKPMIALCMGPFGLMSRVLARRFGALLTFATDEAGEPTAPGQPTIRQLTDLYRFREIDDSWKVYGVIGWPVEHSLSPRLHNAGFAAVGHPGVYMPMPVPPEYEHFKATVHAMIDHRRLHFAGASVTIPHKEHLLRFVLEAGGRADRLSGLVGAANTLLVGATGAVSCINTDGPAAVAALREGLGVTEDDLADLPVAVLGAGGVARAIAGTLSQAGAAVTVINRSRARADALAEALDGQPTPAAGRARVDAGPGEALASSGFRVIVNCTSVGMAGGPAPDESPLTQLCSRRVPLDASTAVMDTVYAPRETPLLRQARSHGARTIDGQGMFLLQAAAQLERWTGRPAPMDVLRTSVEDATSS